MPFIDNKEMQVAMPRSIGADAPEDEGFELITPEKLTAAFKVENEIGSAIARTGNLPDSYATNPDFNPISLLTDDELLDDIFVNRAAFADNTDELEALRVQSEQEQAARELIADNGMLEVGIAAFSSPITFIPFGGAAYKTYRLGSSILKSAVITGGASAAGATLSEAALHYSQVRRTYGESALNVTAAALLGGVLGATPATVRKMLEDSGHDPDAALRDLEQVMDPEKAIREGGNPAFSGDARHAGAAEADLDINVRGKVAKWATDVFGFDPLSRTITSDLKETRIASNKLVENPIDMDRDFPTSTESTIKTKEDGILFEAIDDKRQIFVEWKKAGGVGSERDFNEMVGKAVRNGSDDPLIQKAADSADRAVYEPIKGEAIEAKLLNEDVEVSTAKNYLNRLWSKEKIADNLPDFLKRTKGWLKEQGEEKVKVQADVTRQHEAWKADTAEIEGFNKSLADNAAELKETEIQLKEAGKGGAKTERVKLLKRKVAKLKKEQGDIDANITAKDKVIADHIADLEESVSRYKSKVKVKTPKRKEGGKVAMSKDLQAHINRITRATVIVDDVELQDLSQEIAGRIMSSTDGRLPYDYKMGQSSTGFSGKDQNLSSPFKGRSFAIPDELMEDFLENDIELLMTRYVKNTVPDIELTKAYGDVEMTSTLKDIEQGWISKMNKETDPKTRRKMNKEKAADLRDMTAMRDRIRGVYNIPDANNVWVRTGRVAKDLNYMRLLGGVVAASIPDVGKIIMAEGIVNTFGKGLKPLVTNLKAFKLAAREAKMAGVGTDALMGGRAEIIADTADYAAGGTAFERLVRSAATKFSSINMMNQWTAGVKQLHAVTMQTRIGDDLTKGIYDKRLGQLGISKGDSEGIAQQLKQFGKKMDGVWVANTKDWSNPELVNMWRTAIRKDSDRVIIVPGQEKPLFMSTQMGSVVGQFKTFMFSATQRILISNLQAQDKYMMQGVVSLVSLGMMSYAFKQWDAGREITDDPTTLVMEGIDRSGAMGILMEMNNTIEKISGQTIGMRPAAGIDSPASRYASRNVASAAVGPTLGLAGDLTRVAGALSQGEVAASDLRAVRRLLPMQNLSLLRQGFDALEAGAVDGLGLKK